MKREREVESITMANYLMFLSQRGEFENMNYMKSSNKRVFECKTCNRQFSSFQALGGHRASHKKLRLMVESDDNQVLDGSSPKPKTHECSICGLEFSIGQALGGHMRRHRTAASNNKVKRVLFPDLNLTPLENDLEFLKIGKATPLVHCLN